MFDERLPTHLWVGAGLARCSGDGIAAVVVSKGDPHGGMVLVRVDRLGDGVLLFGQERGLDGSLGWRIIMEDAPAEEPRIPSYVEKASNRDPDLWVIDVEDRNGRNPFDTET